MFFYVDITIFKLIILFIQTSGDAGCFAGIISKFIVLIAYSVKGNYIWITSRPSNVRNFDNVNAVKASGLLPTV